MRLCSLISTALASTCLMPGLLSAQNAHDDLREEIRKIVREEIRAALSDLKGHSAAALEHTATPRTVTVESTKKATATKKAKSAAKAAAEEVEQIVLNLDDITNDVAEMHGGKIVRTRSPKSDDGKPMVLTLRCEDGQCVVEEGGDHDFVVVHGEEGGEGECPMLNLGNGAFTFSFGGDLEVRADGKCCDESECCDNGKCCEGGGKSEACEGGECAKEPAANNEKPKKTSIRVIKPADGLRLEGLDLQPMKARRLDVPIELKLDRKPIEVQLEEVQLEGEPKVIEVQPLKIRSKTKNAGRGQQNNVVVNFRPTAV